MKTLILALALLAPTLAVHAAEKPINIPHDPGAQHALVKKSGHPQQRVVVTRREGTLGVLYSRHVYNCERATVSLLGTAENLEGLDSAKPLSGMLPVVEDSTAYYIAAEACS
ncbi:hypothetical protein NJC40_09845 [Pseudomonas sp. 21LCFQ02]|uniref:hypothetical protein n=1 Tax=Pseudomonas sp. 21LCFQ02 TaxID=2957505 RepID=UPI00209AA2B1|nr:hypothetical protein [Pseudomonas sp. 21LCFQ02]MCO8168077.1 hypothetical protein [Pseudomonas sp. 21LCFQ02]